MQGQILKTPAERAPRLAKDDDLEALHACKFELSEEGKVIKTVAGKCYPDEIQEMLAESLLALLNAHIRHEGSWRVVWRDPVAKAAWDPATRMFRAHMPTVLQCQYLDEDGDVWCVVNIEEKSAADIIEEGVSTWVEKCEDAYQYVREMRKALDIREGKDTICRAKGEKATDILPGHEAYPTRL